VLALGAALLPFASEGGRARWQGVFEHATVPPPELLPSNLQTLPGGLAGNAEAPILASSVGPWAVDSGERRPPSPRRKVAYVGLVAALVATVAVGGGVLYRGRHPAAPSPRAASPTGVPPVTAVAPAVPQQVRAPPTEPVQTPPGAAFAPPAAPAVTALEPTPGLPTTAAAQPAPGVPAEPGRRRRPPAGRRQPGGAGGASSPGGTYFIP
jgi:hypothetical protein